MFLIPGSLISLLTFPGVILHEWSHKKFCDWFRIPVFDVSYFSPGYVVHAKTKSLKQTFWISTGPFFLNTLITVILAYIAGQVSNPLLSIFLLWLALSAGVHAIPSNQDMSHLREHATGIIGLPLFLIIGLVWVANIARFFWFDFIYAGMLILVVFTPASFLQADEDKNISLDKKDKQLAVAVEYPTNEWVDGTQMIERDPKKHDEPAEIPEDTVIVGKYRCKWHHALEVDTLKPDETESQMAGTENHLKHQANSLDRLNNEIERSNVNEYSSQWEIDQFNQKVDEYNSGVASYQREEENYNMRVERYNAAVIPYNSYLEKNCTRV